MIVVEIYNVGLICWMCHCLLPHRFSRRLQIILTVILSVANGFLMDYITDYSLSVKVVLTSLVSFTLFLILYNEKIIVLIFYVLLSNYIYIIGDSISINLFSYVLNISAQDIAENKQYFYLMALISKIIAFITTLIIIICLRRFELVVPNKYWVSLDIISLLYNCLLLIFFAFNLELHDIYGNIGLLVISIYICFYIISIITFYFFITVCKSQETLRQNIAIATKLRYLDDYIYQYKKIIEDTQKIRHDMKGHLDILKYYLDNENHENAQEYIHHLLNKVPSPQFLISYSDNNVLNAIVNLKKRVAVEKAIDINITIDITSKLPLTDVDLASILDNLLDNAIEACEKLSEIKRSIDFRTTTNDNYFLILISNPYVGEILSRNGRLFTQKEDTENHGFGYRIVQSIVAKYDGICDYYFDNKIFNVSILIPLISDSQYKINQQRGVEHAT